MKTQIIPANPSRVEIITATLAPRAVEWLVTTGETILAGGICATHKDARSDAGIWCEANGKTVLATRRTQKGGAA